MIINLYLFYLQLSEILLPCHNRNRKRTIRMECAAHRVTRATEKLFLKGNLQQSGTIVQQEHATSRKRPKNLDSKNRITTTRAISSTCACPFHFIIFLCTSDSRWYLSSKPYGQYPDSHLHMNHLLTHHLTLTKNNIAPNIKEFVLNCVAQNVSPSTVRIILRQHYNVNLENSTIRAIRNDHIHDLISGDGTDVSGMGAARRLIALYERIPSVSYMYVTHTIKSGLVTYQKKKSDEAVSSKPSTDDEVGVASTKIEHWRTELAVKADEILVCFAFVHDDELR